MVFQTVKKVLFCLLLPLMPILWLFFSVIKPTPPDAADIAVDAKSAVALGERSHKKPVKLWYSLRRSNPGDPLTWQGVPIVLTFTSKFNDFKETAEVTDTRHHFLQPQQEYCYLCPSPQLYEKIMASGSTCFSIELSIAVKVKDTCKLDGSYTLYFDIDPAKWSSPGASAVDNGVIAGTDQYNGAGKSSFVKLVEDSWQICRSNTSLWEFFPQFFYRWLLCVVCLALALVLLTVFYYYCPFAPEILVIFCLWPVFINYHIVYLVMNGIGSAAATGLLVAVVVCGFAVPLIRFAWKRLVPRRHIMLGTLSGLLLLGMLSCICPEPIESESYIVLLVFLFFLHFMLDKMRNGLQEIQKKQDLWFHRKTNILSSFQYKFYLAKNLFRNNDFQQITMLPILIIAELIILEHATLPHNGSLTSLFLQALEPTRGVYWSQNYPCQLVILFLLYGVSIVMLLVIVLLVCLIMKGIPYVAGWSSHP